MRGADIGSDHHLLIGKVKIKLKRYGNVFCKEGKRMRFQVNLLQDPQKRQEFHLELKNRFELLGTLEDVDVDGQWEKVKEVMKSTCSSVLGEQRKPRSEWITLESLERIGKRREAKQVVNKARTRKEKLEAQRKYSELNKSVKNSIKKDKNVFLEGLAERAEKAAACGQMKIVYDTTRIISGKHRTPITRPVKDKHGNDIYEQEGQLNRWREHFEQLLNRPPPESPPEILPARLDLPINTNPPTKKEIEEAIRRIKSNKAAGPDHIPPEAIKADMTTSVDILHTLFTKIWNEEDIPGDWKKGILIKLPKKGDLGNCNNYRGITLLSIPGKVFNRIILNKLKDIVDPKLRDNQAGFRKNRSCVDQITTLRLIVEQSLEWNSSFYINFIDYEKAFDSVDRDMLWKIMRHYGIPEKIVNLVRSLYVGTNCQVSHDGQLSEPFQINTGVRQGCLLSPFLFTLAVDWILKESTKGKKCEVQWTPWIQLEDLDFADDLSLMSHTKHQMQSKTDTLDEISKSI